MEIMKSYFKKVFLCMLIVSLIFVVIACSSDGGTDDPVPNTYNLTVNITDRNGQAISATVTLSKDGQNVSSKTGFSVEFQPLLAGTYNLSATADGTSEELQDNVVIGNNDVIKGLQFTTLPIVQEIIFESTDTKSITIEDLASDENVMMGVATFDFDSDDATSGYIDVSLSRGSDTTADIIIQPMEFENPEYVYSKPIVKEIPRVLSVDNILRVEDQLLVSSVSMAELPDFGSNIYTEGDTKSIWYENFQTDTLSEIATTVRAVGDHCVIFVDDTATFFTDQDIQEYVNQFDNNIFDNNTSFFNDGFDIDGNNKVGIVLIDMGLDYQQGIVAGYFTGRDFFSQQELDDLGFSYIKSNEGDFIYVNSQLVDPSEGLEYTANTLYGVIAHEFQHELYFYRSWENDWIFNDNYVEDSWINEGMSTFAEALNGYIDVDNRIATYFAEEFDNKTNHVSLLYWSQTLNDYGISNLFTNYLVEQYTEGVHYSIYLNNEDPIVSIENYTGKDFSDIYMDFIIANKLYSLNLATEYSYNLDLASLSTGDPAHITLSTTDSSVFMSSAAVKYYQITGDGSDVTVNISGTKADNSNIGVFVYRY